MLVSTSLGGWKCWPLKLSQGAMKLAITDFMLMAEACCQRGQQRGPLVRLQRSGRVDDGEYLRFAENKHGQSQEAGAACRWCHEISRRADDGAVARERVGNSSFEFVTVVSARGSASGKQLLAFEP
jgi:hypothetical protein